MTSLLAMVGCQSYLCFFSFNDHIMNIILDTSIRIIHGRLMNNVILRLAVEKSSF